MNKFQIHPLLYSCFSIVGLCRTSEIFGVSEYVLGKMRHMDDKAFQGLSVTAHKWIPITEVYSRNRTCFSHSHSLIFVILFQCYLTKELF